MTRFLHLAHRWLGIVLGLMVLAWFVSGLIMLFVGRPELTEGERLAGLPALDTGAVKASPLAAWQAIGQRAGQGGWPEAVRLNAARGQPAYQFLVDGRWQAVSAAHATLLPPVDAETAGRLAVRQRRAEGDLAGKVVEILAVDRDQWTVYRRFDAHRPFWRVEFADGELIYVGQQSGEIVLDAGAAERAWNWAGTVVHWLYIVPLRERAEFWRQVILWTSFASLLLAVSGLWLGWQRWSPRQRYPAGAATPYREKWKRWHHLFGLAGGLFIFTWLLSGWLSMGPLGWAKSATLTPAERQRLAGGPLAATALSSLPALPAGVREAEWLRLGETMRVRALGEAGHLGLLDDAGRLEPAWPLAELHQAALRLGRSSTVEAAWQHTPNTEYYDLRHHPRSYPVARLQFADPAQTRLYLDPQTGRPALLVDRDSWAHRWLYHGLHRFDMPPLHGAPLARDGLVIALSLLGGFPVCAGLVLGWRRLGRRRAR